MKIFLSFKNDGESTWGFVAFYNRDDTKKYQLEHPIGYEDWTYGTYYGIEEIDLN